MEEAKKSAEVTHNHSEGVKGAQATALSIFLARKGETKEAIKEDVAGRFHYDLDRSLEEIRPTYGFDISCQGSVPESIIAFLESISVEDAIRKAISLGGDSDTMACIAGGIAQAFYKEISSGMADGVRRRLPEEFLGVIDAFNSAFGVEL
jgi:ADP-ribosylglycohydrolase